MIRAGLFVGLPMAAAAWFSGLMDFHYTHTVSAPPDLVAKRLGDLDLADAPGADGPGLKSSRITHQRTPEGVVWTVRSNGQVAMRFYADLKPVEGGTKTEVSTRAERGDAPDDAVVPMFRNEKIALGLFTTALEGRLAETAVPQRSREWCQDYARKMFEAANEQAMAKGMPERDGSLMQAVGRTSKDAMRLAAMQQELQNQGCAQHMNGNGGFPPPGQSM